MLRPFQYWSLCALAAASVILVGVNAGLYFANGSAQAQVSARAQYIQQSQSIGALYQEIAKALAKLTIEHHDDEIRALLTQEGFTISATPPNAPTSDARRKP